MVNKNMFVKNVSFIFAITFFISYLFTFYCFLGGKAFISPGGLYTHTQQAHRLEAG